MRLLGRDNKYRMPREQDYSRSCWMCGYFGPRNPEDGNSGRCHNHDDIDRPEALLIPSGFELEIASSCKGYFRRSQHLDLQGFISWRNGIKLEAAKRSSDRDFRIVTLLVAGAALIDFACKSFGIWR